MKFSEYSFPHPVLGIADDVSGVFESVSKVNVGLETTKICIGTKLRCDSLEKMIQNKQACHLAMVHCSQTLYRKSFSFYDNDYNLEIPTQNLCGKVEITFMIVSLIDTESYCISGVNSEYKSYDFVIEKGDALAYGGSVSFIADKTDFAVRSVKTIMQVIRGNSEMGEAEYSLTEPQITIKLSETDFLNYKQAYNNPAFRAIFHATVAYPALIYALSEYVSKSLPDNYLWMDALDIKKQNDSQLRKIWEQQYVPNIAQRLLGLPIQRCFKDIIEIIDREDQGDE